MIDLYASTTPNVLKVTLMLEECGLEYRMLPMNVWRGEQFAPDFVALNPNSKVPVIVDHDGPVTVFESVAILFYLAEKCGHLLPASGPTRYDIMQWMVFQAANLGPANGQFNHLMLFAPQDQDYGRDRYTTELHRVYGVMETRLTEKPYLGGDEFSIADLAAFPWVWSNANRWAENFPFLARDASPGIADWYERCAARPAVQRGLTAHGTLKPLVSTSTPEDLDRMFGRGAYAWRP
ncbi:glutathione binding-like protein [Aquamicrobium sp. LC103]|uniref:glutathione S-transferase family protein n=1 Tax=Aquamicrobium sp. LC103 TaxID=1120658 RepID=UPI00063EAEF1|nr:glutathione binding-like protein [Aquamicrobium sp. LC103]TKT75729.1 glutathione S-transferase [Aquamicrobium sp. LC103]